MYKKAVKHEAKGRVAFIGPGGSGKSYTAMVLARALAGPDGTIAALDTEHGSLSKYADLFDFDVEELSSYAPDKFLSALKAAEQSGYAVFVCDSLSHFWMGKDGALEFVDSASKRYKDNMGGWKEFRPHERAMVDAMIASPLHVIVTMRTKTEYVEEINPSTGKKQRRKIGLAPVQREGLEYEFDLVGYMDDENTFLTDKTRCPGYAQKAIVRPDAEAWQPFVAWLKGAPVVNPYQKLIASFAELKAKLPEATYYAVLDRFGAKHANQFKDFATARECYKAMHTEAHPRKTYAGGTQEPVDDNDIPAELGGTYVAPEHATRQASFAPQPPDRAVLLLRLAAARQQLGDERYLQLLGEFGTDDAGEMPTEYLGEIARVMTQEVQALSSAQPEAAHA